MQILALLEKCKSIVITGHSIGGTTASLTALWLLSYLQSVSSSTSILCLTFGSPLLGNRSLSRAILRERWGGNFCHVVAKHDIMPRLLFAPSLPLYPQVQLLLQYWNICITSPQFQHLDPQLPEEDKLELLRVVLLACSEASTRAREEGLEVMATSFWPFGNYFFCSDEGAICIDNAASVINMLHLMLRTSSPISSIKDHLRYGDYVGKLSYQFLHKGSFSSGSVSESSYEAGIQLALASSGLANEVILISLHI